MFKKVDGGGKDKEYSQFAIQREGLDRIKLRNVGHKSSFVVVKNPNELSFDDVGGREAEFYVVKHGKIGGGDRVYSFESVTCPGTFIGFDQKGNAKEPKSVALGVDGQFTLRVVKWVD